MAGLDVEISIVPASEPAVVRTDSFLEHGGRNGAKQGNGNLPRARIGGALCVGVEISSPKRPVEVERVRAGREIIEIVSRFSLVKCVTQEIITRSRLHLFRGVVRRGDKSMQTLL